MTDTPLERETRAATAAHEYDRTRRRLFHAIGAEIGLHGRQVIPPMVLLAYDTAEDAREAWLAVVADLS